MSTKERLRPEGSRPPGPRAPARMLALTVASGLLVPVWGTARTSVREARCSSRRHGRDIAIRVYPPPGQKISGLRSPVIQHLEGRGSAPALE